MAVLSRMFGCQSLASISWLGSRIYGRNKIICNTATRQFRRPRDFSSNQPSSYGRRAHLTPEFQCDTSRMNNMGWNLVKCTVFSAAFCTSVVIASSIWQYENRNTQKGYVDEWIHRNWVAMEGWQNKKGSFRQSVNKWWNGLTESQQVFMLIFSVNAGVFLLWQRPALRLFMMRNFAFTPAAKSVCLPMLLSTFSHYSLLHLGINMYVMYSFSTTLCQRMGREEFLSLYLCSGITSSLASAAVKVLSRSPNPSLGASGAILGMIGYFCSVYPDARLGIVFIPNFSFSAEQGLYGLLLFDFMGLILRWGLFDHAAHLGGVITGMIYAKYEQSHLKPFTRRIMMHWHQYRTSSDRR